MSLDGKEEGRNFRIINKSLSFLTKGTYSKKEKDFYYARNSAGNPVCLQYY